MASFNTITRASFFRKLDRLYDNISMRARAENKMQYKSLYTTKKADGHVVRVADIRGFGLVPEVKENANLPMFETSEGYAYECIPKKYGAGFRLSQELIDDDRYEALGPVFTKELAEGAKETKEYQAVAPFDNGHTTFKFPDGQPFFSTQHKGVRGVTISNTLSVAAQLSETTLQNMELTAERATDDNGKKLQLKVEAIIIPNEMKYDMHRLTMSNQRPGTANNDTNAWKDMWGSLPVYTNQYLSYPGRFYMKTSAKHDACLYQRKPWKTRMVPDYISQSVIHVGSERYDWLIRDFMKFVSNGAVT